MHPPDPAFGSPSHRDSLQAEIAREESLLAGLEVERKRIQARLESLRSTRTSAEPETPVPTGAPAPTTVEGKVALFRSLFRGRSDVYPRLWVNRRTGKKGYAPACSNEWVEGICAKPRVKCGECPNQAFLPVTDRVLFDHLRGRHVVGVYPLLEDETCWFLAVDFDGEAWLEDTAAYAETCGKIGVPIAVERSRSGNGAHAWSFFTAPVAASAARKMGCFLLTETMARRHLLAMRSYDRLFPNQDTMPRGGFGNLIALPLQHAPRQQGNTVFLDGQLVPHADQWAYLASIRRIEPSTLDRVVRDATRRGQVIGVRIGETDDEEGSAEPWTRPPSGRAARARIAGPLPKEVRAVLAQRLFVEKEGLPSALLNRIKRLAAFQNPEFYKKQRMRLSVATTPRVIACAEDLPQHVALPRGCRPDLETLLREHDVALRIEDKRTEGGTLDLHFDGALTPIQREAALAMLANETGVFVAPPGIGKTVVGVYLIATRARNTLILVHRRPLLDQWVARLSMFLGVDASEVGRIAGGKRSPNGRLDVAMIQSLVRGNAVDDLVATYGHVIVDECHHVPAVSFERVLSEARARYVAGLTATPLRRDGRHPILGMQLGPVRFAVDPRSRAAHPPFRQTLIVRETGFRASDATRSPSIQETYRALASDERRNRLILDDVSRELGEGRSCILLTERRDHLEQFRDRFRNTVRHLVVLQGGMKARDGRAAAAQLAAVPDGEARLVLATGRYVGEGFDDARLETLFLALPISWKGTLVQYAGRLHRLHPGKGEVRIYDYVDREVPVLSRMFEKRSKVYRAIGYLPREAGSATSEGSREGLLDGLDEARSSFGEVK